MWFIITYHLGLRGRELQCKLRKNDLEIFTHNGNEYCQLASEFGTKNHQGGVMVVRDSYGQKNSFCQIVFLVGEKIVITMLHTKVKQKSL